MLQRDLAQYQDLRREIKREKERLDVLMSRAKISAEIFTGMPHAEEMIDNAGCCATEIAELRGIMQTHIRQCMRELLQLHRFIYSITDSQIRQIFMLRYVRCMSWQQIAFEIGEYDEQYPRRKHNAYLKNL